MSEGINNDSEERITHNLLLPPEIRFVKYRYSLELNCSSHEEVRPNTLLVLPLELRLKIYSHLLTPAPSNYGRSLLTVLSRSEEMSDDYKEAVKLKKRINVFDDSESLDDAAILTDLNSMLKIRHFKLYWNTAVPLGKYS